MARTVYKGYQKLEEVAGENQVTWKEVGTGATEAEADTALDSQLDANWSTADGGIHASKAAYEAYLDANFPKQREIDDTEA